MTQAGLGPWLPSARIPGLCIHTYLVLAFTSHLHKWNIALCRYLVYISVLRSDLKLSSDGQAELYSLVLVHSVPCSLANSALGDRSRGIPSEQSASLLHDFKHGLENALFTLTAELLFQRVQTLQVKEARQLWNTCLCFIWPRLQLGKHWNGQVRLCMELELFHMNSQTEQASLVHSVWWCCARMCSLTSVFPTFTPSCKQGSSLSSWKVSLFTLPPSPRRKGKKKKTFSEKENDSYQSHIQEIWYRYLIFEISEVGCTWHSCYCPVATPTPHTALGEFFFWVWSEGEFVHWPLISLLLSVSQSATLWAVTGGGCKLHQVRLVFITSSSVQHDQGWMDWWKEREEKRQRKKARKGKENGDGIGGHGKGREESHVLS